MSIKGRITINEVEIFEIDSDPTTGGGVKANAGSLAIKDANGIWEKIGATDTDWALLNLSEKSGVVATGAWSGNPKKVAISFTRAFPGSPAYGVQITGEDGRTWTIESKSASGFTINSNANAVPPGNTYWKASLTGETA